MSFNALDEGSSLLRLEFYARNVVHHRGLFAVLRVVATAWWNRPRIPPNLTARQREDMGLPPARHRPFWPEPSEDPVVPLMVWRMGL